MGLIGHAKWCDRKGQPGNLSGGYCSTCGEKVKQAKRESEEDRLRRQLAGAVAESERLKRTLDTAHRDWRRQVEALEARIVRLTTTGGQ